MNFLEAKNAIEKLRDECATVESELRNLSKEWRIINTKRIDFESIHKDLIKQIKHLETIIDNENMFETVNNIEGFDTLLQEELVEISTGMDRRDYRNGGDYPRWNDLERLVKNAIEIKKQYPGWILKGIKNTGQYDTFPPQTFYESKYQTPQGHYMCFGGLNKF